MLIVVSAVSALALILAMVWLAERRSGTATSRGYVLRYHPASIGVGLCFSLGPLLVFVLLLAKEAANRQPVALHEGIGAFAVVMVPALWFTLRACRTVLFVFPRGLVKVRPGRMKRILWTQVEAIVLDAASGRYRVVDRNGRSLAVSQLMTGQREFAVAALDHVPPSKLDCEKQLRKLASRELQ